MERIITVIAVLGLLLVVACNQIDENNTVEEPAVEEVVEPAVEEVPEVKEDTINE